MCGIVGFIGREQAAPILLEGLSRLEYRGYDSAGLAVYDREKGLQVVKAKGRLQVLRDLTDGGAKVPGTMGLGHTRWATHGAPNDENAYFFYLLSAQSVSLLHKTKFSVKLLNKS